jgi:hypothetical protein
MQLKLFLTTDAHGLTRIKTAFDQAKASHQMRLLPSLLSRAYRLWKSVFICEQVVSNESFRKTNAESRQVYQHTRFVTVGYE